MATKPGDGKTNPFGDGKGGAGMGKAAPTNFLTNPRGSGASAPKPRDLRTAQAQPAATGEQPSTADAAPAGLIPQIDPPDAEDIGTRPLGQNAHKPFKLGG